MDKKPDWWKIIKLEYRYELTSVIIYRDSSTGTSRPGSIIGDQSLTDDVGHSKLNKQTIVDAVLNIRYYQADETIQCQKGEKIFSS